MSEENKKRPDFGLCTHCRIKVSTATVGDKALVLCTARQDQYLPVMYGESCRFVKRAPPDAHRIASQRRLTIRNGSGG